MAKPKYRLKREFRGKIIARPEAQIDGDFFHRYANANEMIESNPKIAKHFETMSGDVIAVSQEPLVEEAPEGSPEQPAELSKQLKAPDAIAKIAELEGAALEAFIEGEDRVTVLQAAGEKLG